MRDILVTSSVLILVLLILRQVFRRTISRRVQYALWGLVLVRLLVPVSLPAMEHNVLTTTEPVRAQFSQQLERQEIYIPTDREPLAEHPDAPDLAPQLAMPASSSQVWVVEDDETAVQYQKLTPSDLLRWVWYTGTAVMACWLVISNFRFWRKLCKVRMPYSIEGCKYPVYLVESGLPSPCLFGLFRPAVYLTPAAVSPENLRHVLAHETTHARHLDPLWSLLRGVCLAVYWFDPLVWAAAIASKTDCELACDEGALKRLGETERIAYGRTLLSLIPVARRPADPMLAATTMTSGKRKLKERITRIAENRQTAAAALFAVVAAAGLACAVTFTGAKAPGGETGPRPLTGAELEYFNEEFFNGDNFNIRNQFLTCLYDSPEDIDLFSLFYNGAGTTYERPDEAERRAVAETGYGGYYPDTDLTKITAADMDAVLTQYTGLTLAETNQVDLDAFTYLPAYDAYYSFHGDTNARGTTTFFTGEREGDTIRLYYTDFYFGGYGPCCVTLEARPDGSYWFVSHLFSDMPAIPPALPDWEPVLTVPLTDLEPYEAPTVTVERHTGDVEQLLYSSGAYEDTIVIYRSTDGNTYAALEVILPSGEKAMDCFLTFPEGENFSDVAITDFYDLLGRSGVMISYYGRINDRHHGIINDYYYVTDEGAPSLLARAYGDVCVNDLDGDGQFEIAASAGGPVQLFFQRDGTLYCADIESLLESAWPEAQYLSFGRWDMYSRCLSLSGEVPIPDSDMQGTAFRQLYFNGSDLLLYRDETTYTDHVKDTVNAPEDVLAAAREYVLNRYARGVLCYDLVDGDMVQVQDDYDDWRITDLSGPYYEDIGGLRIEIWQLGYECHTSTQYQVSLAGGSYITEDRWCMIGYYDCDYLYFQVDESGNRTYLYTAMENDCVPGTEMFRTDMVNQLTSMGLLALEDVDGQTLLEMLSVQPAAFLNGLVENQPEAVQTAVIEKLGAYIALGGSDSAAEDYASCVSYIDRWPSDFMPEAQALWARLQAAAEGEALLDGETALAQFTANPAAFLRSAAQWPEERQAEVCRALAYYYDGGPSASQARFRDAMRSVTQDSLDSGGTAVYELLRTSCALPGPAERSEEDDARIEEAARLYLEELYGSSAALVSWEIDAAETARVVSRYTASLLANGNGWTDEYTTRMAAVLGVYESGGQLAARYCYLLPDAIDGSWSVLDSSSAAVPETVLADWLDAHPAETAFAKSDVEFTGRALSVEADAMSYEERLAWCEKGGSIEDGIGFTVNMFQTQDSYIAYDGNLTGVSPGASAWKYLYLRFPDGTLANLPLPKNAPYSTPLVDTAQFADGKFVYSVSFPEEMVDNGTLIHLAGTYHYEVDLSARTVSLTVLDN